MPYVITQPCCNDATCVEVCPVDCIRPKPGDPAFVSTEMLYIDPDTCIDCGACADACPVDAIVPADELTPRNARYEQINADYFQRYPLESDWDAFGAPDFDAQDGNSHCGLPAESGTIRIAIVGAGASACYAADALTTRLGEAIEVEMFDRLPTPWGLIRAGVAPDHQGTKSVTDAFRSVNKQAVRLHLNVDIGTHLTHEELMAHHHAVIYANGAAGDRRLGIPGEDLLGCHGATAFVAWYNGHPDYAHLKIDLSCERAVIIGNGNVALDIARILVTDPSELAGTDIADHALEALRHSAIREVVVIGRRGPAQAAYTNPELLALGHIHGVDIVVDPEDLVLDERSRALLDDHADPATVLKVQIAEEYAAHTAYAGDKRIVLRYLASPTEVLGHDRVEAVNIVHNELTEDENGRLAATPTDRTETITTGLVLRSIGYRGLALPGLPPLTQSGALPNIHGRVLGEDGVLLPGVYTTGWLKRGPSGGIGTNRHCANETVDMLAEDLAAGLLPPPSHDRQALTALVTERRPEAIDWAGWQAIDEMERERGQAVGRPRRKFVSTAAAVAVAQNRSRAAEENK
ncbi:4Fe-4S binding protein [Nocardia tengchongensis]|uniref:4Fe-4S binding protein n=1 Tax=Nocardia tengchongensis TaxID=2055889 RepID=UPI0036980AD5